MQLLVKQTNSAFTEMGRVPIGLESVTVLNHL